jgi:hypothetical protein
VVLPGPRDGVDEMGAPQPLRPAGPDDHVPLDALAPGESPRRDGVDLDHVRAPMQVHPDLSPIVVHCPTMRVIDGMHRRRAAHLRGDRTIRVTFVTASDEVAFVLAVQGEPDARPAVDAGRPAGEAQRTVLAFPHWSDREIARHAGVSATVAGIRPGTAGGRDERKEVRAR